MKRIDTLKLLLAGALLGAGALFLITGLTLQITKNTLRVEIVPR